MIHFSTAKSPGPLPYFLLSLYQAGPEKSVAQMPGTSIFSCWARVDCWEEILSNMCVHAWWADQLKYVFFQLHPHTYNLWYKAGCECQLYATSKLRFHICSIRMRYSCVLTPLSPSFLFFLRKPVWTLKSI